MAAASSTHICGGNLEVGARSHELPAGLEAAADQAAEITNQLFEVGTVCIDALLECLVSSYAPTSRSPVHPNVAFAATRPVSRRGH